MVQEVAVGVILSASAGYALWRVFRALRAPADPCEGCTGCPVSEARKGGKHKKYSCTKKK